jgi:hypothetical protein
LAYVSAGFFLEVTVVDNSQVKSVLEYQMTGANYAAVTSDAPTVLNALAAVSDSNISGYHLVEKFYNDAFAVPTTGRSNKEKAVVSGFIDGNPTKSAVYAIPNPTDTIFAGAPGTRNYNVVDIADTALAAYSALFQTGGKCYISDGEVLGAVKSGVRVTRSSRNP